MILVAVAAAAACAPRTVDDNVDSPPAPPDTQRDVDQPQPLAMYPRTYAPSGAAVSFLQPRDGAVLQSPITVRVEVANVPPPALHVYLLVDAALPDERFPVADSSGHIRFADGESSIDLELSAGEHKLTLLLADALRMPLLPPVFSRTIRITVVQ